jgi:hypothetical protein
MSFFITVFLYLLSVPLYCACFSLILLDSLTDVSSLKAIVAAVTFMLRNAAKYNVKPDIVSLELQQLGLPKRM